MPRDKLKALVPSTVKRSYLLGEQAGFLIRIAMQRHTAIFTSRMIGDLTQTQFASLAKLYEVGSCSQNQLGRLIFLDNATIKGVVDRLSARGLVDAVHDLKDRRRFVVSLTERGRQLTKAAIRVAVEITAETLAPLNAAEQRTAIRLLKKLS